MLTYGTERKFWISIALCFCKKDNLLKTIFSLLLQLNSNGGVR